MEVTPVNVVLLSLAETAVVFNLFPDVSPGSTLASSFAYIVSANLLIFALYKSIVYPFFLHPLNHLPEAKGFIPILGHSLMMFERPSGEAHRRIMVATPNEGIIHTRGFFHTTRLLVTSPAALADILVHNNYDWEKPVWARTFLRKILGDGLLMTEGDEHKHHRKLIMPAFHFRHIKELYPIFWNKSVEMCDVVRTSLVNEPSKVLELGHYSTQVTLDIIGLAGLGREIGSLRNSDDEMIENYEEILEPTSEKGFYFLLHLIFPPWFIGMLPWKLNKRVVVTTTNLKRICGEFVAEKKAKMKLDGVASEKDRDILSIMMRSNDFSDENLVDQLLTFMAAGHETTSSALTWASYLLSTHPAMQTRLRSEIHQYIPDPKVLSEPGFDIASLLESMPYLNGVCNEVLRLFPTIPVTSRVSVRDTTVAGQLIPKDTMIFIVPWAINRHPDLWGESAEQFVPERWIDKETGRATMNGGAYSNFAFLTFIHGPRSCIGEKFARAELRALVTAFVGHFEMQMANPNEKVIVGGTLTSKSMYGMNLKLKPLKWSL